MTSGAPPRIAIRPATVADAALLAEIAAAGFADTFAADNDPVDMRTYLASAFGPEIQRAELEDPRTTAFLAEREGEVVGYAMMRQGAAPDFIRDRDSIEIARLYSVKRWIGSGVGAALMHHCLAEADARGCSTIWLGVWEHNARAIAFYRRWGFTDVGSQVFRLGRDRQTDRVMARRVLDEP
jgi:ribosomal protein S18 acetylase RimI-like enzyme